MTNLFTKVNWGIFLHWRSSIINAICFYIRTAAAEGMKLRMIFFNTNTRKIWAPTWIQTCAVLESGLCFLGSAKLTIVPWWVNGGELQLSWTKDYAPTCSKFYAHRECVLGGLRSKSFRVPSDQEPNTNKTMTQNKSCSDKERNKFVYVYINCKCILAHSIFKKEAVCWLFGTQKN